MLFIYGLVLMLFTQADVTTQDQRLLFSSNRNGSSDIFLMDVESKEATPLTRSATEEWAPTWINAQTISFLRQKGDTIIRVSLSLQTGKEEPLDQPDNCRLDDKNMLYHSSRDLHLYTCAGAIFLHEVGSGPVENLTAGLEGISAYAAWGKEGEFVLFTNNGGGNNDVYSLELATGDINNLTKHPANDERGDLSPDGRWLLFSSNRHDPDDQDIWMLNLENGATTNITNSSGTELIARWSADGKKVFFGSDKSGNWEIYAYEVSSRETTRLTFDDGFDGDPRVFRQDH